MHEDRQALARVPAVEEPAFALVLTGVRIEILAMFDSGSHSHTHYHS